MHDGMPYDPIQGQGQGHHKRSHRILFVTLHYLVTWNGQWPGFPHCPVVIFPTFERCKIVSFISFLWLNFRLAERAIPSMPCAPKDPPGGFEENVSVSLDGSFF